MDWNKVKQIAVISLVILTFIITVGVAGYYVWQQHKVQPVIYESQKQAETSAGVALAAKDAHINMLQSQLEEAAGQIAYLKNKSPDTVIKTVPVEVPKIIEVEREKRGTDFAIVTNAKEPDKKVVDVKEISKLPVDTPITLNQYNVFAYKKIVRGINIYPDWSKTVQGNFSISEVSGDINRKISKDGKYLGVTAGYDFDNKKAKVGLRYTF